MSFIISNFESNLLKIYRRNQGIDSYLVPEAILLALHKISSYFTGKAPGTEAFENPENIKLRDALLFVMAPFSNEYIKKAYDSSETDYITPDNLRKIFVYHVANLIILYKKAVSINEKEEYNSYLKN